MSRPRSLKPGYCLHRPSGRAYVTLDGKAHYLGAHNTQESRDAYDVLIAEWIARGRVSVPCALENPARGISISRVIAAFWQHAQRYYGEQSRELDNFRHALQPLRRLYGNCPAIDFGPLKLKALREDRIAAKWSRGYINKQISRVKMVFKWAVEQEMITPSVFHGLQAVSGLKRGKTDAVESQPVRPVPQARVDAVLPIVSRQVAAMIQLQLLTGARPGEICRLRTADIDTSGQVWVFNPERHKTSHHGHSRIVRFGPKAIEILRQFLRPNLQEPIFSPADADRERREALTAARAESGTPLHQGNGPGTHRSESPKRRPGNSYSVSRYCRAIARGCDRAFKLPEELREPRSKKQKAAADLSAEAKTARAAGRTAWRAEHSWSPNQLRHNAATNLRRSYGIEMAQTILGHRIGSHVTEIYAEANGEAAERIIAQIG